MLKNLKDLNWKKAISLLCTFALLVTLFPANSFVDAATAPKTLLKNTITYCSNLVKSEYTSTSWTTFQKELKIAKATYAKKNVTDKSLTSARDALEKAKASLIFVTSKAAANPQTFRDLTVDQIVDEMGAGWNLGNTMDGHTTFTPGETVWQSNVTTKALIKKVHDTGFNTIRIPVTYGNFIDDANNYAIKDSWISRVQDIVDYAISEDMYVIINVHHDGAEQMGWLNVAEEDIDPVYEKFEHVWRNIAERFKDYDEHLIFESMNEITGGGESTVDKDLMVIKNLNQIFVNVVRSTGSNNAKRWLSVPGRYTNIDNTTNAALGFKLPIDTVKNRLFLSVHEYDYALGLVNTMDTTKFSSNSANGLINKVKKLYTSFTSKGIPVILGEYGAANKNNTAERAYYYEVMTKACAKYGVVAVAWDAGDYDLSKQPSDYNMTLFNRATLKEVYPDIINAALRGTAYPLSKEDSSEIIKSPTIKKITDLTLSNSSLTMSIGDSQKIAVTVAPSSTNDTVVWKSSDSRIATVYNGQVRARGIGTTTLTASTRSGSIKKEVIITVNAKKSSNPATSITTDKTSYQVNEGNYLFIKTSLAPTKTDDYVTYKSSDESIASVSTLGKIVGVKVGKATITITSSNGLTKTVSVTVKESVVESSNQLTVALNVYYSDRAHNYYSNEYGKAITITKNGQYTITFDCASDLSKAATKAGVTSLNDLGAIYIKDHAVTLGKSNKSALVSCDIKYDKILVDGVPLTITQKKSKSAIKPSSGIMDTNDPLNAWDGSFVKEVKTDNINHVLNITKVDKPKKIEVTFTISNLVFK